MIKNMLFLQSCVEQLTKQSVHSHLSARATRVNFSNIMIMFWISLYMKVDGLGLSTFFVDGLSNILEVHDY